MKILHTSDWHLGHRLHDQSQHEEQQLFLQWLQQTITGNQIDVLLLAGDVFDTGVPATQSQKLYYDFLVALQQTTCQHVVIVGGNHDAPGTLNAPKELLQALSVHVIGRATDNIADQLMNFTLGNEKLQVAGVPYLRDQDIRKAVAGETFDELGDRYKSALVNHYNQIATLCEAKKDENTYTIATGHLFAIGGSTSDSEQSIYVGNLGDIGSEDFSPTFDYIALGHLHKPQIVDKRENIRYSGSPYKLSFSELSHTKQVLIVETEKAKLITVQPVDVPIFRTMQKLTGAQEQIMEQLHQLDEQNHQLTPWIEIQLTDHEHAAIVSQEIKEHAAKLDLKVLKIGLKQENRLKGLEKMVAESINVRELSPLEVFRQKCIDSSFDLEANPDLEDAFLEILSEAKGQ